MNILFLGDVVGKPGRHALSAGLPALRQELKVDVVIANAENLAHGFGVTPDTIAELTAAGVDVCTSGNHVWKNEKGFKLLAENPQNIIRPANYTANLPGRGWTIFTVGATELLVINLLGKVFIEDENNPVASPYAIFDQIYGQHGQNRIVIVDFHAEATGEKKALSWHADGRAALIGGTHTHILTADEQIMPKGTAYITDLGMVGAANSSLGMDKNLVLQKNVLGMDVSLEPPSEAREAVAQGVLATIDPTTKKATKITRIDQKIAI